MPRLYVCFINMSLLHSLLKSELYISRSLLHSLRSVAMTLSL